MNDYDVIVIGPSDAITPDGQDYVGVSSYDNKSDHCAKEVGSCYSARCQHADHGSE